MGRVKETRTLLFPDPWYRGGISCAVTVALGEQQEILGRWVESARTNRRYGTGIFAGAEEPPTLSGPSETLEDVIKRTAWSVKTTGRKRVMNLDIQECLISPSFSQLMEELFRYGFEILHASYDVTELALIDGLNTVSFLRSGDSNFLVQTVTADTLQDFCEYLNNTMSMLENMKDTGALYFMKEYMKRHENLLSAAEERSRHLAGITRLCENITAVS